MKKLLTLTICALALTFSATNAAAATALVIGDSNYLGSIDPGSPSSEADEAGYINHLLDQTLGTTDIVGIAPQTKTYVRSNIACPNPATCPDATAAGAQSTITGTGPTNLDVSNFTYLLAKYGNVSYVWYVANLTTVSFVSSIGQGGGLSHYALFNPSSVPDGGTTAGLLGLAMLGLGYLRRRMA